jgi:hypothetical protein
MYLHLHFIVCTTFLLKFGFLDENKWDEEMLFNGKKEHF